MSNNGGMPDLFAGVDGDAPDKVTTSLDGDAKTRQRNKSRREYVNTTPEQFNAIIARAIAEGRHSPAGEWRTVCAGCRQWVDSLVYVSPQDRLRRLCIDCAPPDVRDDILKARALREGVTDEIAATYGEGAAMPETALPEGVTRTEEIGLPEQ